MSQSIKSLKKSVRNLQRKIKLEKRRQEVVIALYQQILSLGEEMSVLRGMRMTTMRRVNIRVSRTAS